jgi:hypothetical protein
MWAAAVKEGVLQQREGHVHPGVWGKARPSAPRRCWSAGTSSKAESKNAGGWQAGGGHCWKHGIKALMPFLRSFMKVTEKSYTLDPVF